MSISDRKLEVMNNQFFTKNDKKILSDEVGKLVNDYLDYLDVADDDESARSRLRVLMQLKNVIDKNYIDRVAVSDAESEDICSVCELSDISETTEAVID